MYDKEKAGWKNNSNKRKHEPIAEATGSPTPATFSLKKKQKKDTHTKAELNAATGLNSMPVSQESERMTSRLKREQHCMILADKVMNGHVMKTMLNIKNTYLNDDQKLDNTISRYTIFSKEDQLQATQHENIHNLFFGDKNDIRNLIEFEGSGRTKR